jgi:hypothetical protein
VKKSYCTRPIFIGRGDSFKKPPRDDRCAVSGGHVSTPTFWGWHFFTKILRIFHGNGSSESSHFPERLVLGNWAKSFHPRNVGVAEFVNIFVIVPQGGKSVSWQGNVRERVLLILHNSLIHQHRAKDCRINLESQVSYLFQDNWTLANSGTREPANFRNLVNSRSHEPTKFGRPKESQVISFSK